MKLKAIGAVTAILPALVVLVLGQSCGSSRYFATPDYFTRQPGTLVLNSGETMTGEISVNNLMGHSVTIQTESGKRNFTTGEVASCRLAIGNFQPMLMAYEMTPGYSRPVFMEKLTPDSSSIGLFEAYQRLTESNKMGDITLPGGVEYDLEYFIHLPGDDPQVVWQLSTAIPASHLQKGLDSLFAQCRPLYDKIKSGSQAYNIYFFPQLEVTPHITIGRLTSEAKAEKVRRIISVLAEYENCRPR